MPLNGWCSSSKLLSTYGYSDRLNASFYRLTEGFCCRILSSVKEERSIDVWDMTFSCLCGRIFTVTILSRIRYFPIFSGNGNLEVPVKLCLNERDCYMCVFPPLSLLMARQQWTKFRSKLPQLLLLHQNESDAAMNHSSDALSKMKSSPAKPRWWRWQFSFYQIYWTACSVGGWNVFDTNLCIV